MKRCPQCERIYYDETLNFCLEDGVWLEGDVSDQPTEVMPRFGISTGMGPGSAGDLRDTDATIVFGQRPSAEPPAAGTRPEANSIAVLPFTHLSSAPDDEYFCDGLAEEIINALAKIPGLRVAARTSAFLFKGRNVDIGTIGRQLGVETILEGSVRKSGSRLRITAQLINTANGYHILSERYDREMKDVFEIQDEISIAVVEALTSKLLGADKTPSMSKLLNELKHFRTDVEAYQLYLRGRFLFNRFNEADLRKALACFEEAIGRDPNLAEAYSGIADVYMWLTELGPITPREGMPKAKAAALKAIELDPQLSEAHTSYAIVLQEFDYDFAQAETEYKRAIELNPNNALAHQMYGALLAQLDRFPEAEAEFERSLALDPLSPMGSWIYPFGLFLARRYDDSILRARNILELDENFAAAYLVLSFAYQMKGDLDACTENYCRFLEIFGLSEIAAEARNAFERSGWEGFLNSMTAPDVRRTVTSYISAVYFEALGDSDAAIESLRDSLAAREGHMVMLKVDPRFDKLRSDERFTEIIDNVGFPRSKQI